MKSLMCIVGSVALIFWTVGCNEPSPRLNAPPQGTAEYTSTLQDSFVYMVDNAMLEDLSMTDIHFVPHTSELNGTGARRLDRYAKLLTVYGGSIRYASYSSDERLVEQRMASVRDYLATTGIDRDRIKVSKDLPGGVGMTAREAIVARNATSASEKGGKGGKKGSSQVPVGGGMALGGQ